MRRIGTLTDPEQAKRFSEYLYTLSIESSVEIERQQPVTPGDAPRASGGETVCDLWIRDESHVDQARQELEAFRQAPDDAKYRVGGEAERIRKQQLAEEKRKQKLQKRSRHQSSSAVGGQMMGVSVRQQSIPVVIGMIVISVIASFATNFGVPRASNNPRELSTEEWLFIELSFVDVRDYAPTRDAFASIKKGQVWRLVTPMFLHGNTYHLAFNMLGLFFLGSAIERLQGSRFMLALLLISGIFGGLVQVWLPPADALPPLLSGLSGSPFSIGASGAVYGLFGYLWIRPMVSPWYPVRMMPSNITIMLGWLVFCIFFIGGIANGAHIGGLVAGVAIAWIVSRIPSERFS